MFRIKLTGQLGPKSGKSRIFYLGFIGKKPVAVWSHDERVKIYKTKATATKNLEKAKEAFPDSEPEVVKA